MPVENTKTAKEYPKGEYQVVGVLEENDIFGELGLIHGLHRSASVRAGE
jgi:CRP-like cAMP-binding protein